MAQQFFHGLDETNMAFVKHSANGTDAFVDLPEHMHRKSWIPVALEIYTGITPGTIAAPGPAIGTRTATRVGGITITTFAEATGRITLSAAPAAGAQVFVVLIGHENI
jgi:hypothetical protein